MTPVARILGVSLLSASLWAGMARLFLQNQPYTEYVIPCLFFACAGGVIGAVAGAAGEIVMAQRQKL